MSNYNDNIDENLLEACNVLMNEEINTLDENDTKCEDLAFPNMNCEELQVSPSKSEIDDAQKGLNLFAQGKRHMIVNDINSAVTAFQEATELFVKVYGEMGFEMADPYYYYGKALLELARVESGVLGNALDGSENGSDESESEADENQVEGNENEIEPNQEEEVEPEVDEEKELEKKEGEGEKTEEEGDEVGNLQLAWEILELSKIIYQKQEKDKPEIKLKTAQAHLKLGEVSLENENYLQSIEDFKECLKIQLDMLESEDRQIAETYYQLGVAHSFCDEYDKASANFSKSGKVIEDRIIKLKKQSEVKKNWNEQERKKFAEVCTDPFYKEEDEIEELEGLLPEIKERVGDMIQMKRDSKEKLAIAKQAVASFANLLSGTANKETPSTTCNSSIESANEKANIEEKPVSNISHLVKKTEDKPVSNISHLVKKKRKSDGESSCPEKKQTKTTK